MKQYEIRSPDLKSTYSIRKKEREIFEEWGGGFGIVVLHEFESEAEADKARQDWLEEHYEVLIYSLCDTPMNKLPPTCREIMDSYRNPPKPTLTILAAPDGWEIPEVQGYVVKEGRGK